MTRVRTRGETIRRFVIANVRAHPVDIASVAAKKFGISRQAINKHLQRMVAEKTLSSDGRTRNRQYGLAPLAQSAERYTLDNRLAEDVVWRQDVSPVIGRLPENVSDIWHYGFTEMFNNAIDHSSAGDIDVLIRKDAAATEVAIMDNGVGIFKKIQQALGLLDERHAVLELAKGKLTTDPDNHTGEGIFFTSRMFDVFGILSGGVYFSHKFGEAEDWILEKAPQSGTIVWMRLHNHTSRTIKRVFDRYTSGDDFGFNKTVVPVRLTEYGDDKLISRSQAKRLLARVDRFRTVVFDFEGVAGIGQAFADQIFRVFVRNHPEVEVVWVNANPAVKRMIQRVGL